VAEPSAADLTNNGTMKIRSVHQPNRFVGIIMYESPFAPENPSCEQSDRASILGGWEHRTVITVTALSVVVSGANTGPFRARHRVSGVSNMPSDLKLV